MFCRWSPTFLIFYWLVMMTMMTMGDCDGDGDNGDIGDIGNIGDIGHGQGQPVMVLFNKLNPGAFSLVLVEKSFLAIFSGNQKVRLLVFLGLYSLRFNISSWSTGE